MTTYEQLEALFAHPFPYLLRRRGRIAIVRGPALARLLPDGDRFARAIDRLDPAELRDWRIATARLSWPLAEWEQLRDLVGPLEPERSEAR